MVKLSDIARGDGRERVHGFAGAQRLARHQRRHQAQGARGGQAHGATAGDLRRWRWPGAATSPGVIVPEMLSEYYARFVHAAIEKFRQKNFSALIATTNFDPEEAVRAVRQMYRCQVKCLLIILDDCEEVSQRLLSVVRQSNLPAMFITATYIPEMDFDCLYVDEARGSVMAVEHLLHRGYSQIAFLGEENTANRRDLF